MTGTRRAWRRGHAAVLIGIAAWSLAALGGVARADDAQVTVVSPGGAEHSLSLGALSGAEDVRGGSYAIRSAAGEERRTVDGFSLAAILEAAGADPYRVGYLEVQRPGGGALTLSGHGALDQGAFPDGPPVVYATERGTGFIRPSAGPGDANAADSFEVPQGIAVILHEGSPLRVRATASVARTRPGKPVDFEAIVEGAGAGQDLSYSWTFGDGESASGPTARHRFAKRGSYDVLVGVTAPGDPTGASGSVRIQVGAPPESGPDRSGGGTNRDADAPDQGAASGGGGGGEPSSAGGGGDAGAGTAPPAAAPPAPASSASPAPQARSRPERRSTPERRPRRERPEPAGQRVAGELLSRSETAPLVPASETPAARTGKLEEDDDGGGGVPDAALGLLATGALLGLGALVELRPSARLLRGSVPR